MIIKVFKKLSDLNNSLKARNYCYPQLSAYFHLSSINRDEEDTPPAVISETNIEDCENLKRTLIPVRITEEKLTTSYYDVPTFYGSPRYKSVILFPGNGYLGMCRRSIQIPTVKNMYEAASQYIGIDMYKLSTKGPLRDLAVQTFQQPAIFLASLAASEKLRLEYPSAIENCVATAGFSIGELTALVFTGALSFEDGLRLSMIRGEAMYAASEQIEGGQMLVHHKPDSYIQSACQYAVTICEEYKDEIIACDIANFISPTVKVIGGNSMALRYLKVNGYSFGFHSMERIVDGGGFHTPLMNVAVQPFSKYVVNTDFEDPLIPMYANDTGDIYQSGADIRQRFGSQFSKPVRWEETIFNIYVNDNDEIDDTFICGPSRDLKKYLIYNGHIKSIKLNSAVEI